MVEQHLPRRDRDDRNRRRLDMGKLGWFRRDHPRRGNGVFPIAVDKTRVGGTKYFVAYGESGCLRADLLDHAGNL
jgi:hypothetical protein